MTHDLHDRLEAVERRYRRLARFVWVASLGLAVVGVAGFTGPEQDGERVIRATEIVIEDPDGVVRARLGGDLPDAVFDGRTVARGSRVAGLLLYDREGDERGGYVTFDSNSNVLLTLDAGAAGNHQQTAYFLADEDGNTALRIWNGRGDHVELRAGGDGARFNAVEDGALIHQVPAIENPAETEMCTELKGYREQVEMDQLMAACRQRMPEDGCRACLGGG